MRSIFQDVRYALRQLRKSPGFAATAVAVLALGIGANIAVFTLVNGIVLRPLPYVHPERIASLEPSGTHRYFALSLGNMLKLQEGAGVKLQLGGLERNAMASIVGPGGRMQVSRESVTASLFPMLGVQPSLGRLFREDENQPGKENVLVLSDAVWRKMYASDPDVVGKTVAIKGQPYTIVGVMPKSFALPFKDEMQVWSPIPIAAASRAAVQGDRAEWIDDVFVRLPDGMTAPQLADILSRQQTLIQRDNSDRDLPGAIKVTAYQDRLNEQARKPLLLLYGVVLGIWALASLNVTSLMLARCVSRTRDQAVRAALGAGRSRLLQQTMVESLLLSVIGAAVGALFAEGAIHLLWRQIHRRLPMSNAVQVDWRVVACMVALTLLTAAIAGLMPALRAMRHDLREDLHGASTTAGVKQNRIREALVVAQLALTLVFLVGAGLFLRTIDALRQAPLGFSQQNVLTGGVILYPNSGESSITTTDVIHTAYLPLLERLRAIPGVKAAALSTVLPLRAEFAVTLSLGLDHKAFPSSQQPQADGRLASPGLVDALGIPLLRGRFFTESDTDASPVVVVVNKAYADAYLPGQDPIGHTLNMGDEGRFADMRIVGEIGDMKQSSVTKATKPEIYFSLAQMGPGTPLYGVTSAFIQVALRGTVPADSLRAEFDKRLHELAPDATTTDVKTIHEAVEDSFGSQTLTAYLLEGFAGVALLIASVGLYGLLSFAVAQRTREIGLRLALGAQPENVVKLVLGRAVLLVAAGLTIGAALAWFAARLAHSYIFGVREHDAATFGAVLLVLTSAALLAAFLPARRAAAVDPILALRSE